MQVDELTDEQFRQFLLYIQYIEEWQETPSDRSEFSSEVWTLTPAVICCEECNWTTTTDADNVRIEGEDADSTFEL